MIFNIIVGVLLAKLIIWVIDNNISKQRKNYDA